MRTLVAVVTLVLNALVSSINAQQPASPLRIVVLEGEGGVNIIQQKTAVRPLVEVRDRNNLPVSGASVTFTIGGGNSAAFAGGAQTLTVTTNAAGQAAASGLNAIGSGAFQIQVQAAYQGQLATAAISQTNFATAAAATQAGASAGASGGGGASGGAAGGAAGGGGMSATTIGIVGAAVAGGAVAATQVVGKEEDPNAFDGYTGPFNGQISLNSAFTPDVGPDSNCTFVSTVTGNLTIELKQNGTGSANLLGTITMISATSTCIIDTVPRGLSLQREETPVTGGPSALAFSRTLTDSIQANTFRFTGSLSGNNINGTLSYDVAPNAGANPRRRGSTTMQVTLIGPRP